LQKEGENKFVIDDDAVSGTLDLTIYPEGQVLSTVQFTDGPDFVFLTDNRLHVRYHSLINTVRDEQLGKMDLQRAFIADEEFSLNSVKSITFERKFMEGISRVVFAWKPEITTHEKPLTIDLPDNPLTLKNDVQTLQDTMGKMSPGVRFYREYDHPAGSGIALVILLCSWMGCFIGCYVLLNKRTKRKTGKRLHWFLAIVLFDVVGLAFGPPIIAVANWSANERAYEQFVQGK
jgi:hypothetical protein